MTLGSHTCFTEHCGYLWDEEELKTWNKRDREEYRRLNVNKNGSSTAHRKALLA